MTQAVAKRDETQVQVAEQGNAVLSMIERAARDPSVDIEKMRQLLQMRADEEARQARREFNEAMASVQAEMLPIAADANNPQTRSKYASYYALDKVLRPIYTRHGFAVSFNTDPAPIQDYVRVIANLSHSGGHTQQYQIDMPADGKGAKGGDVMTKTHAAGAAASYGMRYLQKMIWNVAVGEHDDDGNSSGGAEPITEDQLQFLIAACDEVGADKEAFCKFLKIDGLAMLPLSRYGEAMKALEQKRKKAGK